MVNCSILKKTFCITNIFFASLPAIANSDVTDVPFGYLQMAQSHSIPAEILYSVAMTESNYKLPNGTFRPWPWTINVAGTGYRYETRQEAYDALLKFMKTHPLKRIDVGIAQVNLGWNGHYFRTYWDAFEPYTNLNAASQILKHCFDNHPHSWISAAGCYHHPAGGHHAERYKKIIKQNLAKISIRPVQQITPSVSNADVTSEKEQLNEKNENTLVTDLATFMLIEQNAQLAMSVENLKPKNELEDEFETETSELYNVLESYANQESFADNNIEISEDESDMFTLDKNAIWIEPNDQQIVWVNPQ